MGRGADGDLADLDDALVDVHARDRLLAVADLDDGTRVDLDPAGVADLAAALRVERGAVEDDLDLVALGGGRGRGAVDEDADDPRLALGGRVADEVGGPGPVGDLAVGAGAGVAGLLGLGIGLGALPLLLHQAAEAVLVHGQALLGGHLQGEVDREAPGVVEQEGLVAGQDGAAGGLGVGDGRVEDVGAGLQRLEEGVLLGEGDLLDALAVGDELGVLLAHHADHGVDQVLDHRTGGTQQAHVADGTAHDAAQDVTAAFVAGGHAVADEHHGRAHVVGDHAQGDVRVMGVAVGHTRQLGGLLDDGHGGVDLVHVLHALQNHGEPLEAEARVDVLAGEVAEDLEVVLADALAALVLHEDEVPDLHVALVVDGGAALDAELGAAVVVDLGTGATGSGDTHRPVVVLHTEALDALLRHADDVVPDALGLVVVLVDGDPELLRLQAVTTLVLGAGEQLPGVLDGAFLEVVAEGEVAAHLEERAVPGGLADLFDVGRAHALLHARGAVEGRLDLTQEVGLEGHHAGRDEEQSRVVRDERRRRDDGVTALLEEAQPAAANLSRLHQWSSFRLYEYVVLSLSTDFGVLRFSMAANRRGAGSSGSLLMPRTSPSSSSRWAMLSRTSRAKSTARSLSRWPASIALFPAVLARLSGVSCFSLRLTLVVAHTPAATPVVNQKVRRNIACSQSLFPRAFRRETVRPTITVRLDALAGTSSLRPPRARRTP